MDLNLKVKNIPKIKAVDFFCGGGGMSYGIQKSGIEVLAGIDCEENCRATYKANIKKAKFLKEDVFKLKVKKLEETLSLNRNDDELLLIGCSPCQYWSLQNTNKTKSQKSKNLLKEFGRFVKYFKPGYVVVENVPGVLRKKEESGLEPFINWLKINEYTVHYKVHNTSEYGVPQNRKRFTSIANRVTSNILEQVKANKKLTVRDVIGVENGFSKIKPGHNDKTDFKHSVAGISDLTLRRIKKVKNHFTKYPQIKSAKYIVHLGFNFLLIYIFYSPLSTQNWLNQKEANIRTFHRCFPEKQFI